MSDFQSIITKLLPPQSEGNLIERPRLLNLAVLCPEWQVALLTAPAGYGKSVFMTQLVKTISKPLVWYQIDDYDNDPAIFFQYIVTGIQRHFPGFGENVIPIIRQGDLANKIRLVATLIINELSLTDPGLTLVLDDFNLVVEPVIHRFIQELMNYLPENVKLVMASRTKLPFPLPRTLVAGKLLSIETKDLRFTAPEIASVSARYHPQISEKESGLLEARTNGWPVVFRFMNDSAFKALTSGDCSEIKEVYDFLASEVYGWEPEDIRTFLRKSAVLEVMTPKICDGVLERNDSETILNYLESRQLFLNRLAGTEQTYRYHHLFRDFLIDKLGLERSDLQRRAGRLAIQMGETDRAVEYFFTAGCDAELVEVLPEACSQMFQQGRWPTVIRWFEALPTHRIESDPWLSLFMGRIEVYRGRLDHAEIWNEKAMNGFTIAQLDNGVKESNILQTHIFRRRGLYPQALEIIETLESQLSPSELKQRIDLPMEKSLCLFMAGRFNSAKALLEKTLSAFEGAGPSIAAHLFEALGNVEYFLGNYPKALQYYKRGADISPDQTLPSYYMQDSISTIYQDWGEFDRALEYANRSAAIKEKYGLTEALPSAYLQLASIYVDRNELKRAEEYYDRAINILRENDGEHFYRVLCLVFYSRCLLMQGRWVEARAKVEEALKEAYRQPGLALSVCQEVGGPVFIETGSPAEGRRMLCEAASELERMGFQKALCFCYVHLAWFYFNEADNKAGGDYAAKALTIASRMNYLQIFMTYFDMFQPVLKFGLINNYEATFVQRILVRLGERSCKLLGDLALNADPGVRGKVILPLMEIGGPGAVAIISHLTDDPDPEVRKLAHRTAQQFHTPFHLSSYADKRLVQLHIKMLGAFKLNLNDNSLVLVKWRTVKTRDLFAYLLHHGEPVSKDRILEDLWPETDSGQAGDLFHTTLCNLRQLLSGIIQTNVVTYNFKRYQIASEFFHSDRQIFEKLFIEGTRPGLEPRKAAECLEQAVAVYQGDYLEEMDYVWLIPEREHLKRLYAEALLRLAKYHLKELEYTRGISHLQILTKLNPLDEEVSILLMQAYNGMGNLAAVKEQYQTTVKILNEELGLPPAPDTVKLYRKIIEGRNRNNH